MKRLLSANVLFLLIAFFFSHRSIADPTHMGVEPHEMISLIRVCEDSSDGEECGFKRTLNVGGTEKDFFKIPEGKVLIVTDFEWKYINTKASELENQLIECDLTRIVFCISDCPLPPAKSYAIANEFGSVFEGGIFASGSLQMTTGFVVGPPMNLGIRVIDIFGKPLPSHDDSAVLEATVRGYLLTATCGIPGTPPCR
jgi:hypothetical protein